MNEFGLSYQTPRKAAAEADLEAFEEELKTRSRLDPKLICIDHRRTSVQVELTRTLLPRNFSTSVELSGNVIGRTCPVPFRMMARVLLSCDDYITGEHARQFILALCIDSDEDLLIMLDGLP